VILVEEFRTVSTPLSDLSLLVKKQLVGIPLPSILAVLATPPAPMLAVMITGAAAVLLARQVSPTGVIAL
jgi:hypothetical protein